MMENGNRALLDVAAEWNIEAQKTCMGEGDCLVESIEVCTRNTKTCKYIKATLQRILHVSES